MIDVGLLVSMVLAFGVPLVYLRRRPVPGTDPSPSFVDAVLGAAVVGLVVGRLVALALDDPASIVRFPDVMIVRSGVEFWPGLVAAIAVIAVGARRSAVSPWRRLGAVLVPSMIGYGMYEATCVVRGGCYGPASEIGLRPSGASGPMVPVGLLMGLAVIAAALAVHRWIDRGAPWPAALLGGLAAVATVRAIGSIWLPRVGDELTRPHRTSIVVAAGAVVSLGVLVARRVPVARAGVALLIVCASLAPLRSPQAGAQTPPIREEEGQIERLYRAVFDRAPDDAGFAYWYRLRTTTVSLDRVAAEFIVSREFAVVAGAPTDAEFIELLYRNVLDRAPDAAGAEYWQRQMAAGLGRVSLLVLFSESPEFVASTGTALPPLPLFLASIQPVDAASLGATWRPGCPVEPSELVRLRVSTVGFDGVAGTGELIVHRSIADRLVEVFDQLYEARYPIERMAPVSAYGGSDDASMAANNSSAFNCRTVTGGTAWSRHAYGMAIDLNPLQNPYVRDGIVLPPAGSAFVDRTAHHPAMIRDDDVVVDAFTAAGWRWGGDFRSLKDWQHFER